MQIIYYLTDDFDECEPVFIKNYDSTATAGMFNYLAISPVPFDFVLV